MVEHQGGDEKNQQQSPYMLFLLVLVFFITGLVGILICHILKKKGYRCRTSPEELDPEMKEDLSREQETIDEISNEDTVERIVKCIIQNEANAEALKQMLGNTEGEVPIVPKFRVTHIGKKSSIQSSQDDPNIGSEPASSDNAEEQQATKSINGVTTHRSSLGLSQNGPESVGFTKLESQIDAETRLHFKNGLKTERNLTNSKGLKDRRSSAPEQTVAQRERVDILQLQRSEQSKEISETAENQAKNEYSSQEQ